MDGHSSAHHFVVMVDVFIGATVCGGLLGSKEQEQEVEQEHAKASLSDGNFGL